MLGPVAVSWHSFVRGTHLLFSPAAAHLYALHGALQIGPVTYVALAPLVFGLPAAAGRFAAMALTSALGLVILDQARRLLPPTGAPAARRRFLLAGAVALAVWSQLAVTYVHPDDALALLLAVLALRLVRADRAVPPAVLLGLAVDCKPWALGFLPLLMVARRRRAVAFAAALAAVVAAWLPFYVLDPASTAAARFRIANVASSSLRALGVSSPGTPVWDRPAQIGLGAALALLAVRRGRWPAVVAVVVCARLLLDPSTKTYYDAGLLVGALLCDVLLLTGSWPLFSLSAVALFSLPRLLFAADPDGYGVLRTAYLVVLIAVLLLAPLTPTGTAGARTPSAPRARLRRWSTARTRWS